MHTMGAKQWGRKDRGCKCSGCMKEQSVDVGAMLERMARMDGDDQTSLI